MAGYPNQVVPCLQDFLLTTEEARTNLSPEDFQVSERKKEVIAPLIERERTQYSSKGEGGRQGEDHSFEIAISPREYFGAAFGRKPEYDELLEMGKISESGCTLELVFAMATYPLTWCSMDGLREHYQTVRLPEDDQEDVWELIEQERKIYYCEICKSYLEAFQDVAFDDYGDERVLICPHCGMADADEIKTHLLNPVIDHILRQYGNLLDETDRYSLEHSGEYADFCPKCGHYTAGANSITVFEPISKNWDI